MSDHKPSTVLEYAASVYDDGGPYPYRTTRLAMAFWNAEQAIRD